MADVEIYVHDDVVLVRWNRMTLAALDEADRAVKMAHEKMKGSIAFIAVLASECPLPDEAVRTRQRENLPWMQSVCSAICLVFEGTGLKVAALRSVAASVFLILGNRKMHMCNSLEEALRKARPEDAVTLESLAREAGITAA